jgi:hypothetical protein
MKHIVPFSAFLAISLGLYGCSGRSASGPPAQANSSPAADSGAEHVDHAHGEHAHGDQGDNASSGHTGQSDMDEMMSGLAKLSPEDRASAERQHVCPVSDEMLGMMGPPLKIDVNGQPVWICCPDCKDELLAHPDKYLAKLKAGSSHD